MEKPRAFFKMVYSCFDCDFFKNKTSNPSIEKEKYRCMIENRDFEFQDMSPEGVPGFCPLPRYDNVKNDAVVKHFRDLLSKLDAKKSNAMNQ